MSYLTNDLLFLLAIVCAEDVLEETVEPDLGSSRTGSKTGILQIYFIAALCYCFSSVFEYCWMCDSSVIKFGTNNFQMEKDDTLFSLTKN